MKRTIKAVMAMSCCALFGVAVAQSSGKKSAAKASKKDSASVHKVPKIPVFLGKSELSGGEISKRDFDKIAQDGIRIKGNDSATILGFTFTYAERNLYEDSAANPIILTDFLTEYCFGDSLSSVIKRTIPYHTKPGDTATYDDIRIRLHNGKLGIGQPMKFVISRQ